MRTLPAGLLPIFRSEMQLRLLGLLLLQPERTWTLQELAHALDAPASSVHRELKRAEQTGILLRDASARPHTFRAASEDPLFHPLSELLRLTVGVEDQLRAAVGQQDVAMAMIHGSWASGRRRPDSDIDVLVVGDADLRELRRRVRPVGRSVGRNIDLVVVSPEEFRQLISRRSSFARSVLEGASIPLIGDTDNLKSA
ncbi:MAG TPA: nucleotidyltransferase domain-containing protein [Solirubrobacteraceae bacterium]|nr:nucleotidyltransferase domain-containing protein [Solirubrobacteraceae bacterium]